MKTLSINFYNNNITDELRNEFMQAVEHENCTMNIQLLDDIISKLNTKIANVNETYTKEEVDAFKVQLTTNTKAREEFEQKQEETLEIYNKVIEEMTRKNDAHFGNNKDVVRTVLRVLASWNNSKLIKLAIIPAFESPALYNALETIHINSKAGEDGNITMSKEVKDAYKNATKELDSIIKNTFSLPFETPYTSKTRLKMTAEDRKLLNDCYIKGFNNKFDVNKKTGVVTFKERQVNTLVKVKTNKKTGEPKYDYSGLASVIANIVLKHYFA